MPYVKWMWLRFLPWLLVVSSSTVVRAQGAAPPNGASALTALGMNSALGALFAASRAWLGKRDVKIAAIQGAAGGALVFVGKALGPTRGPVLSWSGVGLTALGSSVVSNAGQGKDAFSEVLLPVGPLRLRVSDGTLASVSLNAFETVVLANRMYRRGLHFDLTQSLRAGAVHFLSERRPILYGLPGTASGVTEGSIVVVSNYAIDPARTRTHEMIHVKQQWFLSQNFSAPVENAIRQHWGIFRVIPAWIDVGVAWTSLSYLERKFVGRGRGPLLRFQEREAELFERLRPP